MNTHTWLVRLDQQLPGWHVWCSSPGPRWNAVPAPVEASHDEALRLPHRVSAATPQELRALCRERYGWDDYCGTCAVVARECGHRTPEIPFRSGGY